MGEKSSTSVFLYIIPWKCIMRYYNIIIRIRKRATSSINGREMNPKLATLPSHYCNTNFKRTWNCEKFAFDVDVQLAFYCYALFKILRLLSWLSYARSFRVGNVVLLDSQLNSNRFFAIWKEHELEILAICKL